MLKRTSLTYYVAIIVLSSIVLRLTGLPKYVMLIAKANSKPQGNIHRVLQGCYYIKKRFQM